MAGSIEVLHYDAFSSVPNKGNPAGVVIDADDLSGAAMQEIAHKVGFNETAFVMSSDEADYRFRFFTPGHEIPLCGHGTVATGIGLQQQGGLCDGNLTIETMAGVLSISIRRDVEGTPLVEMEQAPAEFVEFLGSREALADALGIAAGDLHPELPIVYGSTGTWTLIVPAGNLSVVESMRPVSERFPSVLTQMPRTSIHPFSLETNDASADLHGRHFSSPFSGTIEDPVTGTASGVMGAYMATYLPDFCAERNYKLQIEQGAEVGRDGRVRVCILNHISPYKVRIAGTGVFVKRMEIDFETIS